MVISHRGRKTGERENSIAAFEKAFEMGAEGIECDARITKDGKVVINHDYFLKKGNKRIAIYQNTLSDIFEFCGDEEPLTGTELFKYIEQKKLPFLIEVKSVSTVLIDKLAEEIENRNLWNLVHIIGFSVMIKTAMKMQDKYPKLRVIPFLNLPVLSFVKPPKKSYGVFLGWIDEWRGSQFAFQKIISQERLKKLKKIYEKNGFKVMAGVINNERGLRYFKNAGITDIVTDEIELAAKILK